MRISALGFLMVIFCLPLSAQVPIYTGVKAGATIANVSNSNNGAKGDFYVGGFLSIDFSPIYQLQPELVYSRQGYRPSLDGANADPVHLNYLSIMLANKIYPSQHSGLHFILGPALDFKVGSNQKTVFDEELERFDFALFGGLGYEFPFGLSLEGRFKHGLVDIFGRNKNSSVAYEDLYANQVFQFGCTFQFNAK